MLAAVAPGPRLGTTEPDRGRQEDRALPRPLARSLVLAALLGVAALAPLAAFAQEDPVDGTDPMRRLTGDAIFDSDTGITDRRPAADPDRLAFFGDLHVHTTYSFDAYAFGTLATPADAYRFARGEEILHPGGFPVALREPLDFYAVTDHAMFLGVAPAAGDTTTAFSKHPIAVPLNGLNDEGNRGILSILGRVRSFANFLPDLLGGIADGSLERETVLAITRDAWRDIVETADLYNDPGRFTTFVAYEYTSSTDDRGNLHRNVIFRGSDRVPTVPFSRFHSQNPEGLWTWMDSLREQGIEALAIPHNSNGSNGQMFKLVDWAGDPIDDAYAERRRRNEPLVEITQVKGTSETHPALSTTDEWADFEIMPYRVATMLPSEPKGSYVRDALRSGLALESQGVTNPYDFGFVAASDTHTGASSQDESNYFAKIGLLDANAQLRGSVPLGTFTALAAGLFTDDLLAEVEGASYFSSASNTYGASGLTGVWATENTRDAIYDAFRRKETFATSGPRIRVRFYGGHGFDPTILDAADAVSRADAAGVPMGRDLTGEARAPEFLVWALADPKGQPLDRVQIVKGWVTPNGATDEQVFDVACSGGAAVDPSTHRCPDNGAAVDVGDCSTSPGRGETRLAAHWRDPQHDATHRAFYYARVLENPSCRWSTWDAIRSGTAPHPELAQTIQERAWSSPIWVRPPAN